MNWPYLNTLPLIVNVSPEKSTPPIMPMIGVIRLSTSDLMTTPNAMPMMIATARSRMFPFSRKSRNSLSTMFLRDRCCRAARPYAISATGVHRYARRLPARLFDRRRQTMATIAATDYSMPIGGEWVESDGGRFDVTNPATGDVVGTAVNATAEAALGPWQALAAIERGRILRRASDRILAEADHIAGVMTDEQGKPLAEA